MKLGTEQGHDNGHSYTFKEKHFALLPVKTEDAGWIWLVSYSRHKKHWGWGFLESANFLESPKRNIFT